MSTFSALYVHFASMFMQIERMPERKLLIALVAMASYSIAVHWGVISGFFVPAVLILVVLAGAQIFGRGLVDNRPAGIAVVLLGVAIGVFWWNDAVLQLFFLPPVLICGMLVAVFGSTLLPGATPLITQFSEIMKGDLDQKAIEYTRRVTQAWVIFFVLMTIEVILLAAFAPAHIWSLFTNFINYLFLIIFFLVEYQLRKHLFQEVEHPGFWGFLKSLVQVDPRRIKTF